MVCHVDDLLVWGRDQDEHDTRLHAVLQRVEKAGITLNVEKCELSKSEMAFLGAHHLSHGHPARSEEDGGYHVKASMSPDENELMESTNIYVDCIIGNLPASPSYIDNLKEQLKADSVCSRVMMLCREGWPAHVKQESVLKNYWLERATLTVEDGLLLKDSRLVIPAILQNNVLAKLHEGHQGVVKCKARARQSVWCP